LARETGPSRAKGHRDLVLLGEFEEGSYFIDRGGLHDSLRDESKVGCIVGVGDSMQGRSQDA